MEMSLKKRMLSRVNCNKIIPFIQISDIQDASDQGLVQYEEIVIKTGIVLNPMVSHLINLKNVKFS